MDFIVLSQVEERQIRKVAEDLLRDNMRLKKELKENIDRAFSEGVSFAREMDGGKA